MLLLLLLLCRSLPPLPGGRVFTPGAVWPVRQGWHAVPDALVGSGWFGNVDGLQSTCVHISRQSVESRTGIAPQTGPRPCWDPYQEHWQLTSLNQGFRSRLSHCWRSWSHQHPCCDQLVAAARPLPGKAWQKLDAPGQNNDSSQKLAQARSMYYMYYHYLSDHKLMLVPDILHVTWAIWTPLTHPQAGSPGSSVQPCTQHM